MQQVADYREQLLARRRSLMLQAAEGVQQLRFPDASGVTFVPADQLQALLKSIDDELASLAPSGPAKTVVTFHRVTMRRL